jgi:ABC-2 type transport system ATP-binding protein
MTMIIETQNLRREFRTRVGQRRVAVADLDLAVPQGGVHGFLGPNGSGKTTTIRMLLGLARPTSGTMHLFGEPIPNRLPHVLDRVGAVVESPKFSPNFTGRQNLLLLARTRGFSRKSVERAVETVGLAGREKERYRGYSLGMKQRLAIAATLLKDPQLLILDEPTNGLDPAGIREIREMIQALGAQGTTVLLSSHLLAEVQQVCDSATIIGNGKVLAAGTVSDLLGSKDVYVITVSSIAAALPVLTAARWATQVLERTEEGGGKIEIHGARPVEINQRLGQADIWLSELRPAHADLESVFLQLTQHESLGS